MESLPLLYLSNPATPKALITLNMDESVKQHLENHFTNLTFSISQCTIHDLLAEYQKVQVHLSRLILTNDSYIKKIWLEQYKLTILKSVESYLSSLGHEHLKAGTPQKVSDEKKNIIKVFINVQLNCILC